MPSAGKKTPRPRLPQAMRARGLLATRGMLRLRELRREGIAEETVARLVRRGHVVRLARGLYQLAGRPVDARHSLAEVSKQVPNATICLISALQFHGLTTQLPSRIWIAIDRQAWKPTTTSPPIKVVRFGPKALTIGIQIHRIEGVAVRVYSPAKTVVDCFRFRNKVGTDVAIEALRESLRTRQCTVNEIWKLAARLRILSVMKPYLEVMACGPA